MFVALLLMAPPPELVERADELAAQARAYHDARAFVQAADAYVTLSSLPGVDEDDALRRAHLDLEAAFGETRATIHLCRGLALARGRLARGDLDEQARLSWEETVADDVELLADFGGEASCPPGPPRQELLLAAESPPTEVPPMSAPRPTVEVAEDPPAAPRERRMPTRSAVGLALTGLGVGFAGLMGGALAGYQKGLTSLRAAGDVPDDHVYTDAQEAALRRLHDDTVLARGVAIGLGVASAATLATGIGLLASQRRAARRMALLPSSVPRGGGVMFRLQF